MAQAAHEAAAVSDSDWLDLMVKNLKDELQRQLARVRDAVDGENNARSRAADARTLAVLGNTLEKLGRLEQQRAQVRETKVRKHEQDARAALECDWINSLTAQQRQDLLASLSDEDAALLDHWDFWARDSQLPPDGDWRIWLFLGGRGAGKTRAGAEWIASQVREGAARRIGLIGATDRDVRQVMVEGESGLLAVVEGLDFQPSNNLLRWACGAEARLLSAAEPDSFRGYQFDCLWGDEFAKWRDPQAALDMALMALRLGNNPRALLTTTPRNIPALKALLAQPGVAVTRSGTQENAANLADGFVDYLQARYGGTRLGRQELDGELIEDNDRALWKRGWIESARVRDAPVLERIVVALDPPVGMHGDDCGLVIAGRCGDQGYVLADRSAGGLSPAAWAMRAAQAYEEFEADAIIAEANQGGEMVRAVLAQAGANLPVRLVHATRGKTVRAQPAATLYERGRIHHVGALPELEDQMCQYDGTQGSPDRMDALVWALADLFETAPRKPRVRTI
jgi:phage terminase large subunit-like protein